MKNYIYERELHYWLEQKWLWQKLDGKTVILSGATGMIGKCLVDLFMLYNDSLKNPYNESSKERKSKQGISIIAISRNETAARECFRNYWDNYWFHYISCDVNCSIPECGSADYIIHAASNTHPKLYSQDSIGTITTNVFGTKNLLDYAVSHKAKEFCFLSSVEIYGENRGDIERFDETYLGYLDCNTLRAGYPESKRLGEALCNAYKETYGLDFVIPRLSRVYGPTMQMSDSKAISQFIKKAVAQENIVLKSKGEQIYSYTFVTDAAAAIIYSIAFGVSGEVYNVTDEESDISLKELAQKLAEIAGTKVTFERSEEIERKGYSTATKAMLNGNKLKKLGWEARVHMTEGLSSTVEGCRQTRRGLY